MLTIKNKRAIKNRKIVWRVFCITKDVNPKYNENYAFVLKNMGAGALLAGGSLRSKDEAYSFWLLALS